MLHARDGAGVERRGVADIDIFNGDADGICALTQLRLGPTNRDEFVRRYARSAIMNQFVDDVMRVMRGSA